jgi:rhamnogalacturonyl hydrolase YesR
VKIILHISDNVEQILIVRALKTLYRRLARERYMELAEEYAP